MNLQAITNNQIYQLARDTVNDWLEDSALRLSAALAYYAVFSIAPLLVICLSIAGLVLGPEAVRGELDNQMAGYVGKEAATALQSMVESASKPSQGWLGAVTGFLTLMLGASGVFGQLKDALNTIWEVRPKKGAGVMGFLRARLLNFGMVLVIGFLLLVSLLLTTAIAGLNNYLDAILQLPVFIWATISFVTSFSVVTVLFALIFKVLPDVEVRWSDVWIGAVVTAALFEIGKFGLSFYLGAESTASSYGAAAAVVLLLLWVYYTSCILFLGAEFTQVYARSRGHRIKPSENAEPVTAEARAQEGLSPIPKQERPVTSLAPREFHDAPKTHDDYLPDLATEEKARPPKSVLFLGAVGLIAAALFRSGKNKEDEP